MHRFFYRPQNSDSQYLDIVDKDEMHHLKNVLRLKVDNEVSLIDGKGAELVCNINQIKKDSVRLEVIKRIQRKKEEFMPQVTLACAIPKKSKIDFIVEKLTEIGVDRIVLLKTERTEVNLKDFSQKAGRLEKIAKESLKQSGNLFLPEIMFMNFPELVKFKKENNFDVALMPSLVKDTQKIKDVLGKNIAKNILVVVGPEGDFSQGEINFARENGFIPVRLTESVLKVDTEAITVAGFIKMFAK